MPEPDHSAADDVEVVDGEVRHLPALAEAPEPRPLERRRPLMLPAPAVAAAGGFLAGVATFLLMRVLRRRREPVRLRSRRLAGRSARGREIVASRSFLVDVHLLRR